MEDEVVTVEDEVVPSEVVVEAKGVALEGVLLGLAATLAVTTQAAVAVW